MQRLILEKVTRNYDFRGGLGRAGFVVAALELERPFLAPLYAFAAIGAPTALRPIPVYILLVMQHLVRRLKVSRHYGCAVPRTKRATPFRVDAKAEGQEVRVGGWHPHLVEGKIVKHLSRWFAVDLNAENAPWAFDRKGEPYRRIASLEAMATLLGYMAFVGEAPAGKLQRVSAILPSWTDNRGNSFALNRLTSGKFPLGCLAMELAEQMAKHCTRLTVSWAPRDVNQEADDLSNGLFEGFSEELRVPMVMKEVKWELLPDLLRDGEAYYHELAALRAANPPRLAKRQKKEEALRIRDPW